MLGYDFEIIYKKGKNFFVVDALSRKDEDVEALLCAISVIQPDWITKARDEWKNDEEVWTLIQNLQQDPNASYKFSWKMIYCDTNIAYVFVGIPNSKQNILLELHTSPLEGNSRFLKTYHMVKKDFCSHGGKICTQSSTHYVSKGPSNEQNTATQQGLSHMHLGLHSPRNGYARE